MAGEVKVRAPVKLLLGIADWKVPVQLDVFPDQCPLSIKDICIEDDGIVFDYPRGVERKQHVSHFRAKSVVIGYPSCVTLLAVSR